MEKLKELIVSAFEKGWATIPEKTEINEAMLDCDIAELSEMEEDINKIECLPIEPPIQIDDEENEEGEKGEPAPVLSREERREQARLNNKK